MLKPDVDGAFFLLPRNETKHGGNGLAVLYIILKVLLVFDTLKLQQQRRKDHRGREDDQESGTNWRMM